ncbi:hypothetical protein AB4090_00615 [Acidithiobacillus sp. IBUN Pt1247-S3]|uniref:hypothetical protein n=1 Tax=Acidithiobacillus sp. IBUN Pt1247-S3 TaxID=3166642 RepID=UPI0034E5316E
MKTETWNPKKAAHLVAKLMEALPHVEAVELRTCGGLTLSALFDPVTCSVEFEDGEGRIIARVKINV